MILPLEALSGREGWVFEGPDEYGSAYIHLQPTRAGEDGAVGKIVTHRGGTVIDYDKDGKLYGIELLDYAATPTPSAPEGRELKKESDMDVRGEICKIISRMLDNPDEHGIYPTTRCYDELEALVASASTPERTVSGLPRDVAYILSSIPAAPTDHKFREVSMSYLPIEMRILRDYIAALRSKLLAREKGE